MWFNEGLATQVDYRDNYSIEAWNRITSNGSDIRDVQKLSTSKLFYDIDPLGRRDNYTLAKHEVKQWYEKAGTEGLVELINRFKKGKYAIMSY